METVTPTESIAVRSPSLDRATRVGRVIGRYTQGRHGPVLVVLAGVHGNETSGIFALRRVFERLTRDNIQIRGEILGLSGNLTALSMGTRFITGDLNRLARADVVERLRAGGSPETSEEGELRELLDEIDAVSAGDHTERFFVDCHTTSSETKPYISVGETADAFRWSLNFPVFIVRGLKERIRGTLDEYLSTIGYTGFTFEAGQHDDLASIENHEVCIWLALAHAGCMSRHDVGCYPHCHEILAKTVIDGRKVFRVVDRYAVDPEEGFEMRPGYINFQPIEKGEVLARNRRGTIRATHDGRILMPLYQPQGDDGFFIVQEESEEDILPSPESDVT